VIRARRAAATVGTLAALLAAAAPAYGHPADRFGPGAPWYVFTVASVQWDGAMTADTGDSHAEVRVHHLSQQAGTGYLRPGGDGQVGGVSIRALVPFTLTYTVPAASSPSNCTQTALAKIRINVEFRRTRATVRAKTGAPNFGEHTPYLGQYPLFASCGSSTAGLFEAFTDRAANPHRDLRSTTTRVPIARLRGPAATLGFDYHRSFSEQYQKADGRWRIVVGLRRVRTCIDGRRGFGRCLHGR
jgi:hypothetical protein